MSSSKRNVILAIAMTFRLMSWVGSWEPICGNGYGNIYAGVAHDLNNILSGIVSYPELLLLDLAPDSPMIKPLETIKKSGEKASAIVQDLLTLARRGVVNQEVVNLNDIIADYFESVEFEKMKMFFPGIHYFSDGWGMPCRQCPAVKKPSNI